MLCRETRRESNRWATRKGRGREDCYLTKNKGRAKRKNPIEEKVGKKNQTEEKKKDESQSEGERETPQTATARLGR